MLLVSVRLETMASWIGTARDAAGPRHSDDDWNAIMLNKKCPCCKCQRQPAQQQV